MLVICYLHIHVTCEMEFFFAFIQIRMCWQATEIVLNTVLPCDRVDMDYHAMGNSNTMAKHKINMLSISEI